MITWLRRTWWLTTAPSDLITGHEYERVQWGPTWGRLCGYTPKPARLHPACGRPPRHHASERGPCP